MAIPPFSSPIPIESTGTVTSVGLSGGTTGLTVSGSPVTTSGTITLAGTLAVSNGGTGDTTLTSGNVLVGAGTSAVTTTKAAPAGNFVGDSDTQTLTNKTINASDNTITNIGSANIANGAVTPANLSAAKPIQAGEATIGVIGAGVGANVTVNLTTTQPDANYYVLITNLNGGAYWSQVQCSASTLTTTSFVLTGWNNGSSTTGSISVSYVVFRT